MRIITRHGETIIGLLLAALSIASFVWLLPFMGLKLPVREIGMAFAAFVIAFLAIYAGEWLSVREWKLLKWAGNACTALGLIIVAAFFLAIAAAVIWAMFTGPATDCPHWCD